MSPIPFATITLVGWGIAGVFSTIASRTSGPIRALFWQLLSAFVLCTFYVPFSVSPFTNMWHFFIAVSLAGINVCAFLFYFKSLEKGNPTLAGSIAYSFPLLTVGCSVLLLHESISILQGVGSLITLFGLIFILFKPEDLKQLKLNSIHKDKNLLYALYAMILWALFGVFVKIPAQTMGWFWPIYLFQFVGLVGLFLYMRMHHIYVLPKQIQKTAPIIFFSMLFDTSGQFAYNLGVLSGFVSVVAPIAGASNALFVILSRIIFKEPILRRQLVGILFCLVGILLLSVI